MVCLPVNLNTAHLAGDLCNSLFTLKQNVQTHIFAYHMLNDKKPKRCRRFRCLVCLAVGADLLDGGGLGARGFVGTSDFWYNFPGSGPVSVSKNIFPNFCFAIFGSTSKCR